MADFGESVSPVDEYEGVAGEGPFTRPLGKDDPCSTPRMGGWALGAGLLTGLLVFGFGECGADDGSYAMQPSFRVRHVAFDPGGAVAPAGGGVRLVANLQRPNTFYTVTVPAGAADVAYDWSATTVECGVFTAAPAQGTAGPTSPPRATAPTGSRAMWFHLDGTGKGYCTHSGPTGSRHTGEIKVVVTSGGLPPATCTYSGSEGRNRPGVCTGSGGAAGGGAGMRYPGLLLDLDIATLMPRGGGSDGLVPLAAGGGAGVLLGLWLYGVMRSRRESAEDRMP